MSGNGRTGGRERPLSDAAAQREYDRRVNQGNNAVYADLADREFAAADRIAEHYSVGHHAPHDRRSR